MCLPLALRFGDGIERQTASFRHIGTLPTMQPMTAVTGMMSELLANTS
jgi:hypothetical protein